MSGTVDTSSYRQTPLPQLQLLPMAQGAQNLALGAEQLQLQRNQNAQFGEQLEAKRAIGPIVQSAIDPQTGQLDHNKFFIGLAANPATSMFANEYLTQAVQRQNMSLDIAKKQLEIKQSQFAAIGNAATALLALGDNVSKEDVRKSVALLHGTGVLPDAKMAIDFLQQLPNDQPMAGPDGKVTQPLAQYLKRLALQVQGAEKSIETVSGKLVQTQTGGGTALSFASPFMGTNTPAQGQGMIPNTPTPESLNTPIKREDAISGATVEVPRVQAMPMYDGAGRIINAPAMQNADPRLMADIGPQAKQVLTTYIPKLNESVVMNMNNIQSYNEMLSLLDKFRAGGGAGIRTDLARIAQGLGMPEQAVQSIQGGTDKEALSAAQEFMKLQALNVFAAIRQTTGTGNNISDSDVKLIGDKLGAIGNDPAAIKNMFKFMIRIQETALLEQQALAKFQANPPLKKDGTLEYTIADWPALWAKAMKQSGRLDLLNKDKRAAIAQ